MNRLNRFAVAAQKKTRSWRALWVLIALGLVAVGGGAPGGGWEGP